MLRSKNTCIPLAVLALLFCLLSSGCATTQVEVRGQYDMSVGGVIRR